MSESPVRVVQATGADVEIQHARSFAAGAGALASAEEGRS